MTASSSSWRCVQQHCRKCQSRLSFLTLGILSNTQSLTITNSSIRELVESKVKGVANDKRFVYYLMASAGVCVTPLAGFHSSLEGFRITLLQTDDEIRRDTLKRIRDGIEAYIS